MLDLDDSFYLFFVPQLAEYFAFGDLVCAGDIGVSGVDDCNGNWIDIDEEQFLFACLCTLPMRWSWAVHFCHMVLTYAMVAALGLMGVAPDLSLEQLPVDRRVAPAPRPGLPVLVPYVDDANFVCWNEADAIAAARVFSHVLRAWGPRFRVE